LAQMVMNSGHKRATFAGELAKRLKEREDLVNQARDKRRNKRFPTLAPQSEVKEKVI
jgi:hypothetical protein